MRGFMRYLILLLSIFIDQSSYANVTEYQADNFNKINYIYTHANINLKTTLLVFDLDDTLITMTQALGSVGWWDWQTGLLKNGSDSSKLFTSDINQLIRIQNILFQLVKMEVTDDNVLPFIHQATGDGAIIMGLTARGKEHLSATLMQLTDTKFTENGKLLFKQYGLRLTNDKTLTAGDFFCPQFKREVIYHDGLMFLSGEDKGQALSCILSSTQQTIQTIIFVDDSVKNTQSVSKSFTNRRDINVINILYTKENAKEDAIQTNEALQIKIFNDWKRLMQTLHDVIPQSNFFQ
jgi:hypothetical protein